MNSSILIDIATMLGVDPKCDEFITDIITHINSELMTLNQLGVGSKKGFSITGPAETWRDLTERDDIDAIKTYVYLGVRLIFDPPQNSFTIAAIESKRKELEWRINDQVEREEDGTGEKCPRQRYKKSR